jgi:hypothetical protein
MTLYNSEPPARSVSPQTEILQSIYWSVKTQTKAYDKYCYLANRTNVPMGKSLPSFDLRKNSPNSGIAWKCD